MQIRSNQTKLSQPIFVAVFVLLGSFIFSLVISSSFTPVSDGSAASEVNVEILDSLSLAIVESYDASSGTYGDAIDTMSMDVVPTSSGSFITSTAYVVAGSNNETGYTLTFSDTDDDTDLVNTSLAGGGSTPSTVTTTIPSITSASSDLTDIELNKWGYAFGNTSAYTLDPVGNTPILGDVFNPIPALSTPTTLASTSTEGANTYPFTIATKINTSIPAGTYEDSLVFSLTANYVPPKVTYFPDALVNLQDMSSEICAQVTTPSPTSTAIATSQVEYTDPEIQTPQKTIIDTRDGKAYTIAKLADGKCWMTSNLRLGGTTAITLTPEESDLSEGRTFTVPAGAGGRWASSTTDASGMNTAHVYSAYINAYINDNLTNSNQTIVTTGTPASPSQYIGNHYNWYTATAGTGTYSTTSGETTDSICPKGWRLPTGGSTGEYQILATTYGAGNNAAGSIIMRSAPTNFVLSGVWGYDGYFSYSGQNSYLWTSTPYNNSLAMNMFIRVLELAPYGGNNKVNGYVVRCVAR